MMRNGRLNSRTIAWTGFLVFAICGAVQAQPLGVGYRVFWPNVPAGTSPTLRDFKLWTDAATSQQHVLGVGTDFTSPYQAFVYDHTGFVVPGQTERYYTFQDLFPMLPAWVPATHIESIFYGVNASGRVAGVLSDPNDSTQNILFFFELKDPAPRQLYPIAAPAFATGPIGLHQQVNERGDILTSYEIDTAGVKGGFIFNPHIVTDPEDDEYIQLLDSNGQPLQFKEIPKFNSLPEVAVVRVDGTKIVRFPVGGASTDYEEFTNISSSLGGPYLAAINEAGEFVCRTPVQIRRNQFQDRVTKIGAVVLWTAPVGSYPHDLNETGDILIEYDNVNGNYDYLLHEGIPGVAGDEQLLKIRDMLIAGSYPAGSFENPIYDYGMSKLTDRDDTGFGWIEGRAKIGTNPDGSNIMGWFLLIPEIADAPTTYTFTSTDIPKAIPDNNATGVTSTIAVADSFSITDLNVTLTINHGRAQDLDVYLVAPNGTTRVELFTDVGGNGVNFVGTTLDDEATTAITSGATPFTGSFRPERNLGALDGLSTLGLWKLEVTDDKALKTGTIISWSFTVETP